MIVKFSNIDVEALEVFPNNIIGGQFAKLKEDIKVTPFVYTNPDPKVFKLVLHYDFHVRNSVNNRRLIDIVAEHEIICEKQGVSDLEDLRHGIQSSYLHLQMKLDEKTIGTTLQGFQLY